MASGAHAAPVQAPRLRTLLCPLLWVRVGEADLRDQTSEVPQVRGLERAPSRWRPLGAAAATEAEGACAAVVRGLSVIKITTVGTCVCIISSLASRLAV